MPTHENKEDGEYDSADEDDFEDSFEAEVAVQNETVYDRRQKWFANSRIGHFHLDPFLSILGEKTLPDLPKFSKFFSNSDRFI